MDQPQKDALDKLLGKGYIERKVKKQVVRDRHGRQRPITDFQKHTGLDAQGGITDAELESIESFDCGDPSEGRTNFGGSCQLCGDTFCNKVRDNKPTCYRRCHACRKMMCWAHIRGASGAEIFCSFKCWRTAKPLLFLLMILIVLFLGLFGIFSLLWHFA